MTGPLRWGFPSNPKYQSRTKPTRTTPLNPAHRHLRHLANLTPAVVTISHSFRFANRSLTTWQPGRPSRGAILRIRRPAYGKLSSVCFYARVPRRLPRHAQRHASHQSNHRIAARIAIASGSSRRARAGKSWRTFLFIVVAHAVVRSHQDLGRSATRPIPSRRSLRRSRCTIAATRLKRPQKKSHRDTATVS